MDVKTIELVQSSFREVVPIKKQAAEIFYTKLFEMDPSLKPLFKEDMEEQGKKLMMTLSSAVIGLNDLPSIVGAIQDLGKRHVGYGVKDEHYETVGTALIETLRAGLSDSFTEEVESAWVEVYSLISETMKKAASEI